MPKKSAFDADAAFAKITGRTGKDVQIDDGRGVDSSSSLKESTTFSKTKNNEKYQEPTERRTVRITIEQGRALEYRKFIDPDLNISEHVQAALDEYLKKEIEIIRNRGY
jgi:hypothetical protein